MFICWQDFCPQNVSRYELNIKGQSTLNAHLEFTQFLDQGNEVQFSGRAQLIWKSGERKGSRVQFSKPSLGK